MATLASSLSGFGPTVGSLMHRREPLFLQNSEDVIEVIGADTPMTSMHSVFFGFIHNPAAAEGQGANNSESNGYGASSVFTREDYCLENAVAECNIIRARDGFHEGVLLKCIDSKPMFAYLHYSIFAQGTSARLHSLVRDLDPGPKSQYGAFDELFAIQKSASSPDNSLPSHRHAGFIVSCFKLLDENSKSHNLEKSWLSWTGAREIYKYSPRNWNLRRITLHRHAIGNSKSRTFAYVLMCEFGNILHPSNTIQALDMCERLRARNCGHIALYQVQCNYGHAPSYSIPPAPSPHHGHSEVQRKHSSTSSSSNHGQHTLGWGSPSASRTSPKPPAQQRRVQRNPMLRGYSQDVDSSQETSRRRNQLLRHRENSFGFEHDEMDLTGRSGMPGPSTAMRYGGYPQFEDMS
uniref:RRM domain-containing protein n=1 Tax=Panagrellus redivivus TaxID=6233 RepID=A0A7E4WAE0_PANRE